MSFKKSKPDVYLSAAIRGRTFWSQLSSQHCPLLVRRYLLNESSPPAELGNSDRRDCKHKQDRAALLI